MDAVYVGTRRHGTCNEFWNQQNRPDKKRRKQCRYAIEVTLIYFNTLFAIGAISTRFIKSGKFWTQPDTIQSKPWTNWLQNSQKVANLPFYWTIVDSFQLQGAIPTRSPWPPDRGLCPWTQGLKTLFVSRRTSCYTGEGRLAQWGRTKFVLPHWASRPTKLATKQALIFTVITYKSICML